jgi:Spy/CpxP family protein refolding chaperone
LCFFLILSIPVYAENRDIEEILPEIQYAPLLGITVQEVDETTATSMGLDTLKGLVVLDVIKGSPAGEGGITRGDVIFSLDGKDVEGYDDFSAWLKGFELGSTIKLLVGKGGELKDVLITLGRMPDGFVEGYGDILSVFKDCPMNAGDMHGCYWLKEAQSYDIIYNKVMASMDLTAQQRRKARSAMIDLEKKTIRTSGDIKIAEVELREMLLDAEVNSKKVRTKMLGIGALWSELRYSRFMAHERFKKVLTPGQRRKLEDIAVSGFGDESQGLDDDFHIIRPGSIWPPYE